MKWKHSEQTVTPFQCRYLFLGERNLTRGSFGNWKQTYFSVWHLGKQYPKQQEEVWIGEGMIHVTQDHQVGQRERQNWSWINLLWTEKIQGTALKQWLKINQLPLNFTFGPLRKKNCFDGKITQKMHRNRSLPNLVINSGQWELWGNNSAY